MARAIAQTTTAVNIVYSFSSSEAVGAACAVVYLSHISSAGHIGLSGSNIAECILAIRVWA